MAVDIAGFRLRYPQFDDPILSDALLQVALDDAQCDLSRSRLSNSSCGENIYDRMIYLLAAHVSELNIRRSKGDTSGGGAISSKTVGKVSVSYSRSSTGSTSDEYFQQTSYGSEYLLMLRRYIPGIKTIC